MADKKKKPSIKAENKSSAKKVATAVRKASKAIPKRPNKK